MSTKEAMKVKRIDNAIWRVIDGEVVILIPEGKMLNALTGCGSRIWELIEEETAVSEIVQRICAEYEVEPERASKDINEFVRKLAEIALVEIVPAECNEVSH